MRVLILGSDNFAAPLGRLGWEVRTMGPQTDRDIRLEEPDPDWAPLEQALRVQGFRPQVILVTDDVGYRKLPTGLWGAPPVTCFYGVDSPLNTFWQMPYAGLFDLAFLDQRGEARLLAREHAGAGWLPVGVEARLYQGPRPVEEAPGVCFVGVVDPRVRPKRSAVLARVAKIAPLSCRGGRGGEWFPTNEAARLYRSHQVVLNENLFPGVTTRPLEVMASGGALLTEAAPGHMDQFFRDGEHLVYYGPGNLEERLRALLADRAARLRMAEAGREAVLAGHTLDHRAAELDRAFRLMLAAPENARPRARGTAALALEGRALLWAGARWPGKGGGPRQRRGAGRLDRAAGLPGAPDWAAREAGMAQLILNQPGQALARLAAKLDGEGPCRAADLLRVGLAAWQAGLHREAGDFFRPLSEAHPGLAGKPGEVEFHLGAAQVLLAAGEDLTPGFSRRNLPMALWQAAEHLGLAVTAGPAPPRAWELLGDLLLNRGAATEAHDCYRLALGAGGGDQAAAKMERAGREGYLG